MKKILIVVDMQNGFNRYEQTQQLSNKIIDLTNGNYFDSIIATRFINFEGSQYTRILHWHRLISSPDIDLIKGIKFDFCIDKNIYTCVDDCFIELLKEINGGQSVSHVFICGADTDCCVLKISTDLFERSIMPIVLTNYCNSNGGVESHNAGLVVLKRLIGQRSLVNKDIMSAEQLSNIIDNNKF